MNRKYIIRIQLLFWTLLIISQVALKFINNTFHSYQLQPHNFPLFARYLAIVILYASIDALCFYGSYLFVSPPLFIEKKYTKALAAALFLLIITIAWRYALEFWFFKPIMGFNNYWNDNVTASYYINNAFWYEFPRYFVYGLMCFFIESWYNNQQRQQELQKEKAAAELTFLRSQINPHFLFNSINDIYSLTYQQSKQAPIALLKLSEILRYMLREGNADTMLLQNEITYLENVIELQRISAKGKAYIDLHIEGYIGTQKIATLLLIAFVENAFKHGVLNDVDNPVKINLQAMPDKIYFTVQNKKNKDEKDKTAGIGLTNVRRRLELIYPGTHHLTIEDKDEFYTVNLELQQL